MKLCEENLKISKDVFGFIANVNEVKEESITDYLLWKWREADNRLNYVNVSTFTREQENKVTGADFELELWLVQRSNAVPLLIQAKKFLKDHDAYCGKLNYPANKGRQIELLISYAKAKGLLPFYLFYSTADADTKILCRGGRIDPSREEMSLFMASAYEIKKIADNCQNRKISKNHVLAVSNAFCCLFCCPMGQYLAEYIARYFPSVAEENSNALEYNDNNMPHYVRLLLSKEITLGREFMEKVKEYELHRLRNVAVLDLRQQET